MYLDMKINQSIQNIIREGEGQKIEFKEKTADLSSEIVAFANSTGGRIFLGISDSGKIVAKNLQTNKLKSQITDLARNCDPAITIRLIQHPEGILEIVVPEGKDKPYKCKDGFFVRIGPNSQKLTRDEIVELIHYGGKIRFDEMLNETFNYPDDFSNEEWNTFLRLTDYPKQASPEDLLSNIGVVSIQENKVIFSNAAILFFAKNPQKYFPEAMITCLKYQGSTRSDILDRRQFKGSLLSQIEDALIFFDRYNAKQIKISGQARHEEWEDYPKTALREILINALIHRDYFYDSSHIYMHIYDNNLEVDNPGGLFKGLSEQELGRRAVRRNRMLADLMQRAGYIENAGTGIARIKEVLARNNNPPAVFTTTNFFTVRLFIRPKNLTVDGLTDRQKKVYSYIVQSNQVSTGDCQKIFNLSSDTILNEIKVLIKLGLVLKTGKGKNTRYFVK
jgi:ATP-dependent DNA helicase RecG